MNPLCDPARLLERLGDSGLVVVDCQWRLAEPGAGERDYLAAHIPGAARLDVSEDLSAPPGAGGRHPLPEPEIFARAARRAGIGAESEVVAYDEDGAGGAARLWWLLRHFGHESARVLDGGLRAWRALGGPLASGPERVDPGDFSPGAPAADIAGADELRDRLGDPGLTLLDARVRERYLGEQEPIDPVAGHIPGARNVPFGELAPGGRFLPPAQLRERLGDGEAVAYCGSGVSACTLVLAAEAAGLPRPRLYPGSWSEWSGLGLPVERQ